MSEFFAPLSLARQRALIREMTINSNNIANASTSGFQRQGVSFSEFLTSIGTEEGVSFGNMVGTYFDEKAGEVRSTGRVLDLAVSGPGYFLLQRGDNLLLTRSGAFHVSDEGFLVSPLGDPLLDVSLSPISLQPGELNAVVSKDGVVSASGAPIAQIALVKPNKIGVVRAEGASIAGIEEISIVDGSSIMQGHLEGSNVDVIKELGRIIEIMRNYEAIQSLYNDENKRANQVFQLFE